MDQQKTLTDYLLGQNKINKHGRYEEDDAPDSLSPIFKDYLLDYQKAEEEKRKQREQGLEVDGLALTVGKAYERIRKVIDWKEENALRRTAIYRALKRHLLGQIYGLKGARGLKAATSETMVMELLRTGYFDITLVSDREIGKMAKILQKYATILANSKKTREKDGRGKSKRRDIRQQMKFQTWVLEIAACEIEECLAPAPKEKANIDLMVAVMRQRMKVEPADGLGELDRDIQIELAVRRALFSADNPTLGYQVIKMRYPFWLKNSKGDEISQKSEEIYEQVQLDIKSRNGLVFSNITKKYDAAYRLIIDIMDKIEPEVDAKGRRALFKDKKWVDKQTEETYAIRLKSLKNRLFRSAVWYTLSILVANSATFIIVDGPLARLLGFQFTWLSIAAAVLFPSLIMFFLVMIIRPPKASNYMVVQGEVENIVFVSEEESVYLVKLRKKKMALWLRILFNGMNVIFGLAGLYFIYWVSSGLGLPPTSAYINVLCVTMVFFAGMSVKKKSQEITIEERGSFLEFLWDLFSLPMAKIGSWVTNKWREHNVVAILFSTLIDTPFSALIGVISDWRAYLKDRVAEME
ncbi:MFS transporter [Candidatus Saccharibacteria bacterium]|nr:MFS transporter [Candidatus Saccharibacteria bacterium]